MYCLGAKPPEEDSGVVYRRTQYKDVDSNEDYVVLRFIDDKNIDHPYLSGRRIVMQSLGLKLSVLRKALFLLGDFLKEAKSMKYFIDSKGMIFRYERTKVVPLVFRKVLRILPSGGTGSLLEIDGVSERIKTLYIASPSYTYAGLLKYGSGYILYGLYEQEYKKTFRKI